MTNGDAIAPPVKKPRARRHFHGWTKRQREALERALDSIAPEWMTTMRALRIDRRKLPLPKGTKGRLRKFDERVEAAQITKHNVKTEFRRLKKAIWNFRTRYREQAKLILILEYSSWIGWHFHLVADRVPGEGFVEALRTHWIRHVNATPPECAYVWKAGRREKTVKQLRSYAGKHFDKKGEEVKPDMTWMGDLGEFQPWAFIGMDTEQTEKENAGAEKRTLEHFDILIFCRMAGASEVPLSLASA